MQYCRGADEHNSSVSVLAGAVSDGACNTFNADVSCNRQELSLCIAY
jgi:hypothetical protein